MNAAWKAIFVLYGVGALCALLGVGCATDHPPHTCECRCQCPACPEEEDSWSQGDSSDYLPGAPWEEPPSGVYLPSGK